MPLKKCVVCVGNCCILGGTLYFIFSFLFLFHIWANVTFSQPPLPRNMNRWLGERGVRGFPTKDYLLQIPGVVLGGKNHKMKFKGKTGGKIWNYSSNWSKPKGRTILQCFPTPFGTLGGDKISHTKQTGRGSEILSILGSSVVMENHKKATRKPYFLGNFEFFSPTKPSLQARKMVIIFPANFSVIFFHNFCLPLFFVYCAFCPFRRLGLKKSLNSAPIEPKLWAIFRPIVTMHPEMADIIFVEKAPKPPSGCVWASRPPH